VRQTRRDKNYGSASKFTGFESEIHAAERDVMALAREQENAGASPSSMVVLDRGVWVTSDAIDR